MPTPGGLPKVGEVWELTRKLPPDWSPIVTQFVVLQRTGGSYWSLRVYVRDHRGNWVRKLWVDISNDFRLGNLKYVGVAGPKTKAKLGLG